MEWRQVNFKHKKIVEVPRPFIKWVGGKRQLIPQLTQHFPKNFNKYIEPFVGGGAVFFYLLPQKAVLIDNNPELINAYQVIKHKVEELIESLKYHVNMKEYFYKIRSIDRDPVQFRDLDKVERASRTIYLNKTCYNGLYRVNKKNQFNTPFGRYKNPKICDELNLRAVSIALRNVKIQLEDFASCIESAKSGDFIYMDCPYHPTSDTANFTSYTMEDFGTGEQKRLKQVFKQLDSKGCSVLLSNSYTPFILELYNEFSIHILHATRAVNCDPSKRGKIQEVLISNK
ncbi:MAG: DNA adenine methylase [Candidatus Lokiarchaeota archaeon]|nr:DNA adenine methylase [Candidatus Lokiarchaeota archaeon]